MEAATRRPAEAPAARTPAPAPQAPVAQAAAPAPAAPRERGRAPGGLGDDDLLALQRAVGNRVVARLVGRPQSGPAARVAAAGPPGEAGVIRRASVTLEHTVPAPPRVRQAIEAAGPWLDATLNRVNAWALAELKGEALPPEAEPLFKFIARGDLFFFAQDLSRILVQWSVVKGHGEVRIPPGYQAGKEADVRGFRYVDEAGHAHADSMGEGDDALITFYPVDTEATDEKLTMTAVHELSHATPGLRTEDVAYQSEDLFRYLHLYAAPGSAPTRGRSRRRAPTPTRSPTPPPQRRASHRRTRPSMPVRAPRPCRLPCPRSPPPSRASPSASTWKRRSPWRARSHEQRERRSRTRSSPT